MPYLEGLLHCVIQIEHGLRSKVDAFRLQEVVKLLYLREAVAVTWNSHVHVFM